MADNLYNTSRLPKDQIGQAVDSMMRYSEDARTSWARRWYDNNFFDDGFHFRYLNRTQNKIIDLSERQNIYNPIRAIPKASRQIRGVANLLLSSDPTPIVYPEKINLEAYPSQPQFNQESGQQEMIPNPELEEAKKEAKRIAKLTGHWITEEFKEQEMMEKLALSVILAAKHGVSYIQIYPDPIEEEIRTAVYDAFDIYLMGNLTSIYDSPYIIKGVPMLISQIKANELFEKDQLEKISPDNKLASSDIKQSYMNARYGNVSTADQSATLILKEAYVKEYLNEENGARIRMQENAGEILQGKKWGDMVMRQVFVAGNICLKDGYVKLPDYPFVDVRLEPGPIYQVPLIERFIPQNKALDMITSRIERYAHTMVTGAYLKPKSEGNLNITNQAGGQIIEYNAVPPTQLQIANVPPFMFNFLSFLNSNIEEQGVTTTTLGKLPAGVKSGTAIESLKESEYANLIISSRRLKGAVKRVAEKMLDIADDYFIRPKTVYYLEKGEPQYFDVIGGGAMKKRKELGVDEEDIDAIPLKRDYRVDIEIESGAAYTREGKREVAKAMMEQLLAWAQTGAVPEEAIKVGWEKYLEMTQFGSTGEFMEALDSEGGGMTDNQLKAMKLAIAEVLKDMSGSEVLPNSQQRIDEAKVATAEVIKDTELHKARQVQQEEKGPSESVSFKDLPPEGKVQMASQAGIQLDEGQIRADEEEQKMQEQETKEREFQLKERQLQVKQNSATETREEQ